MPDDDARDVAAERERAREDAQRALLDHPVVVLEEDERASQELPPGEPIDELLGGRAVVLDLDLVALRRRRRERENRRPRARRRRPGPASTPMSASDRVSVGFDLAPMIPFSDG